MKVSAEEMKEPTLTPAPLKGLYLIPAGLWGDNFVGAALTETDACRPENSSLIIGATGGAITGLATGYFSTKRVHTPINTPFSPNALPRLHSLVSNSVLFSSTAWRIAKRTLLGTILFAVLECDFRDLLPKKEDKYQGSIVAGAVCGTVFGLRGGIRGASVGLILFSTLPAALEIYNRRKSFGSGFK